jgi:hypothetical protein
MTELEMRGERLSSYELCIITDWKGFKLPLHILLGLEARPDVRSPKQGVGILYGGGCYQKGYDPKYTFT